MVEHASNSFIWVNKFNESSFKEFYKEFIRIEKDPSISVISIVIDSYGGEVYACSAMRDLIKSSSKPVATIVMGKAMSCGAFLAAAGTKGMRFCSANSSIMIHEISAGTWGKTEEMIHEIKDIARMNKQVFTNMAEDIGTTYEALIKKVKGNNNFDLMLTPADAKAMGVVDVIDIPRTMTQQPLDVLVTMKPVPAKGKGKNKK